MCCQVQDCPSNPADLPPYEGRFLRLQATVFILTRRQATIVGSAEIVANSDIFLLTLASALRVHV